MVPVVAFSLAHDIRIGERSVRLRAAGTGRPLVLLHDLGGSGASFVGLTSAVVAVGREAVAMDLPGCAQSDPLPDCDLGELVDYLQQVADEITTDPIDVVGRGFGGYLALSMAARSPARFDHLILEDPMLPPDRGGVTGSRMAPSMALSGAFTAVRRGRLKQNIAGFGRAKALIEQLAKADVDWWSTVGGVTAKCLILQSQNSRPEDRPRVGWLTAAVPASSRRELAKGAHDDGSYAELITEFIAG